MEKKGKGKQYHPPNNIKAVGKNKKWGRILGKKIEIKKMTVGKNVKL